MTLNRLPSIWQPLLVFRSILVTQRLSRFMSYVEVEENDLLCVLAPPSLEFPLTCNLSSSTIDMHRVRSNYSRTPAVKVVPGETESSGARNMRSTIICSPSTRKAKAQSSRLGSYTDSPLDEIYGQQSLDGRSRKPSAQRRKSCTCGDTTR